MDSTRAAVRSLSGGADTRSTRDIGRRARLELRFALRNGRTVLVHAYAEPPLRVGSSFPCGDGLHLILASSAPGVFGGDVFEHTIVIERGARVRLTSQSALQAHRAGDDLPAVVRTRCLVQNDAHLECEWDPLIPFPGMRLDQYIQIDLGRRARIFWSDAVMSGREARGERWQFRHLAHELRLTRGGALAYLERYRLAPADQSLNRSWVADDCCYFGTVLTASPEDTPGLGESLHRAVSRVSRIHAAADRLEEGLLLVRLMASSGVPFREARSAVKQTWTELNGEG